MYKPNRLLYLFITFLLINFYSCKNDFENYSNNPQHLLTFSTDTVSFDTVLTTVNSPALFFRVYNKNAKPLLISSVKLAGGENSNFKINVDGFAGSSFENIEILAKDSILVLVDVKPKENGEYLPIIINDYVLFETNGVQQKVVLEAVGQDVYTYRGLIISVDSILDNKKPFLIYDSLVIGKDVTVEIGEGTVFYMHNNAQLIVNGTIKIKGTVERPVIFRGSRMDNMVTIPYDLIPGQWGGIRFSSESFENEFENVRIRNGTYGMVLEESDDPLKNKLFMKNVVLTNVSGNLFQTVNCKVIAENCEFSNSKDALMIIVGGSSQFTHCTFANFYPYNEQLGWVNSNNETLIISDAVMYSASEGVYYPVISAEFYNSIIWSGKPSTASDINIFQISDNPIPYLFKNCLIPNSDPEDPNVIDCLFQVDPLFQKDNPNDLEKKRWYPYFDFRLQKDSPAKDKANLEIAAQIPYDLNGYYRLTDGHPDLGAYEFYEEEK